MPDPMIGLIRTTTTLIVGAGLTALANLARRELGVVLEVDDFTKATIISGTTAFVSMLYYAVFATLERRWPAFGVFLGWAKAPRYRDASAVQDSTAIEASSKPVERGADSWLLHGEREDPKG